jgi:hypothetical protein
MWHLSPSVLPTPRHYGMGQKYSMHVNNKHARFEVDVKNVVLWNVMPSGLVKMSNILKKPAASIFKRVFYP